MLKSTYKSAIVLLLVSLIFGLLPVACRKSDDNQSKQVPLDLLFGNAKRSRPKVSPDGSMIAYIAPVKNVLNVWIGRTGSTEFRPLTRDTLSGIGLYYWAPDSRNVLYLQDRNGDEHWHLYAVNLETNQVRDLTPYPEVSAGLLGLSNRITDYLLITMNKENPALNDVYRLELATGGLTLLEKNPGDVAWWIPDAQLRIRGALKVDDEGSYDLVVRSDEHAEWRYLLTWTSDEIVSDDVIGFDSSGDAIYLLDSRESNTTRMIRMETATGKTAGKITVLAQDSLYDVSAGLVDQYSQRPLVAVVSRERDSLIILDTTYQEDVDAVRRLHRGDPFMTSRDAKDSLWVIGFTTDDEPTPYYLYERATRSAEFLFYSQPDLKKYTLAQMEPIEFTARDGLAIHGYITFPPNSNRISLPLMVAVHGGPWIRDYWGFDSEAQWLANRGYACLQVNYRGSTGYGKDFVNAGDHEWGRKMQDDLVDGVNWAIGQGYVDPDRVGIFGFSYGGYASLMGVTFEPDLFRCAVSIAGPTDLVSLLKSFPPTWSKTNSLMYKKVGNPDTEAQFLRSRSPISRVDSVRGAVMIVQGTNDVRVPQADVELFVRELERRKVPVEYILFPDEGHQITRPENRIKLYARAEKFLDRYLKHR